MDYCPKQEVSPRVECSAKKRGPYKKNIRTSFLCRTFDARAHFWLSPVHISIYSKRAATYGWSTPSSLKISLLHTVVPSFGGSSAMIVGTENPGYEVFFKKNLNASKPSEHPPQVEECLKV